MLLVHRNTTSLLGVGKRLSGRGELAPKPEVIKNLYQDYLQRVKVDFSTGAKMYGVYHDYDTQNHSGYSVFVGSDSHQSDTAQPLHKLSIPEGHYLTFSGKGKMPDVVIALWEKVREYFSQEDCRYERSYSVDFEYYTSRTTVTLYISVRTKTH